MGILMAIIIGLFIGAVAKLLMPGRGPGGLIMTILLGIAGAVAANYFGQVFGFYREGTSAGFIASVIGAMLILGIYRASVGRQSRSQ